MKTVPLVIIGSARQPGDTHAWVARALAGIDHRTLDLHDYVLYPYNYAEQYPADDAFPRLIQQLLEHEVLVLATPVYWYAMSAPMKVFFDRFTELTSIYKTVGKQLKGKRVLLLAVGSDRDLPLGFEVPFASTARYFGMDYRGCLYLSIKHPPAPDLLSAAVADFTRKLTD
ncbi:NAD(P)H-dependent oxidoreductase [Hymenobacter koreensis]|uniref:NADPH-dependent FMN reductase-like domain-containing protein n=1 Tax=Hymenobacter koreensis TaxID=1084523 RepID=A0ABP8J441_9BACT